MIKSWMAIALVGFLVSLAASLVTPEDNRWFRQLRRPRWLTFEILIPFIWITIFICGGWSAYWVWESAPGSSQTWMIMGLYLLLEILIIAYVPLTLRLRDLRVGTVVGGIGFLVGVALTVAVWQISLGAGLLLVPYLLWSPIGTYTTWILHLLNSQIET